MRNELLYKAAFFVQNQYSFAEWSWKKDIDVVIPQFGTVRVISVTADGRHRDNFFDDFPQGSTSPAGIRFQVTTLEGEMIFLQKDGRYDLYGEASYNGKLREVKPVGKKTITVYQFV